MARKLGLLNGIVLEAGPDVGKDVSDRYFAGFMGNWDSDRFWLGGRRWSSQGRSDGEEGDENGLSEHDVFFFFGR